MYISNETVDQTEKRLKKVIQTVRHGGKPLDVVGHPAGHTAIVDTV